MQLPHFVCNLCEEQILVQSRTEHNGLNLKMVGPCGVGQTKMETVEWAKYTDVHICEWCVRGLRDLFAEHERFKRKPE